MSAFMSATTLAAVAGLAGGTSIPVLAQNAPALIRITAD